MASTVAKRKTKSSWTPVSFSATAVSHGYNCGLLAMPPVWFTGSSHSPPVSMLTAVLTRRNWA